MRPSRRRLLSLAGVAPLLPVRQSGLMLVTAVHDAVVDAAVVGGVDF